MRLARKSDWPNTPSWFHPCLLCKAHGSGHKPSPAPIFLATGEAGAIHGIRVVEVPHDRPERAPNTLAPIARMGHSPSDGYPPFAFCHVETVRALKESACWIRPSDYQRTPVGGGAPRGRQTATEFWVPPAQYESGRISRGPIGDRHDPTTLGSTIWISILGGIAGGLLGLGFCASAVALWRWFA